MIGLISGGESVGGSGEMTAAVAIDGGDTTEHYNRSRGKRGICVKLRNELAA